MTKPDGRAPFVQLSVVYLLYVGHAKRTLIGTVDFKVTTFLPSLNKMSTAGPELREGFKKSKWKFKKIKSPN